MTVRSSRKIPRESHLAVNVVWYSEVSIDPALSLSPPVAEDSWAFSCMFSRVASNELILAVCSSLSWKKKKRMVKTVYNDEDKNIRIIVENN